MLTHTLILACIIFFVISETLNVPNVDLRQLEPGIIHINWTIPEFNEEVHTVAHYSVQIDGALPIFVKNTSAALFVEAMNITNHTIQVMAIDACEQEGEKYLDYFQLSSNKVTDEYNVTPLKLNAPATELPSIACPQMHVSKSLLILGSLLLHTQTT